MCEEEGLILFNNTCTKLANICMMKDMEVTGWNHSKGSNHPIKTVSEDNECSNGTQAFEVGSLLDRVSSTAEYYERYTEHLFTATLACCILIRNVLGNTQRPGDWDWGLLASVRAQSVACLAAAWVLVAVCLIRGVKTSGKV